MKTNWNYSDLAKSYVSRPEYSNKALNDLFAYLPTNNRDSVKICDVGAGVAHLTLPLLKRGFSVDAVEPNDEMRAIGKKRTKDYLNIAWYEGTGENTGRKKLDYEAVTFGSSFNVTDRELSLKESHRILKEKGIFVCMWNHRDLNDPIQKYVEDIILKYIPNYDYGSRRENQTEIIKKSGLYSNIKYLEGTTAYNVNKDDWLKAWKSHATLHRQAKEKFDVIIDEINSFVISNCPDKICVPYTTKIWLAKKIKIK